MIVRVDDFANQESKKSYRLGVGNTKIFECSLPTAFQDNTNSLWQGQETMLSRWNLGVVDRGFGIPIKCVSGLSNLGDSPVLLKKYINQKIADQSIVLRRQVFVKSWTKSMKTLHYVIYNKSELQKLYDDADEEIAKAIGH